MSIKYDDKLSLITQIKALYEQAQKKLKQFNNPYQELEFEKAYEKREAYGEVLELLGYDAQLFLDEINAKLSNDKNVSMSKA